MKALSIKSPWWEAILSGQKTIETRAWKTNYRGDILICASKPVGRAVAIAMITDCRKMEAGDWPAAGCPSYDNAYAWILDNIRPIKTFPVRGMPGIFEINLREDV